MQNEANSAEPVHLSAHQERAISVAAGCDPRTLRRFLAGKPVMPMIRERIARALKALGAGESTGAAQ